MSTRANIVRENLDDTFDSIYTHWDGYPSHHGPILLTHYSNSAAVDQLMKLGDLSILGDSIGAKHDFDDKLEGACTAYGRDRGETGVESKHHESAEALAAYIKQSWTEWVYVWREADQRWYFTNNPSPTWFKCCGKEQRPTELLTEEAIALAS